MISSVWNAGRRLVPRWRSLSATLDSQELASNSKTIREKAASGDRDFLIRLERWRLAPGLVSAAELVETAIVEGREIEAVNAARRLLTIDVSAAPLIRAQAAALLIRTGQTEDVPADALIRPIHSVRPRYFTRLHPRDPLAWVELALHQTIGGYREAALRSMTVALSLAPTNRHVLRSAARLFLHQNDPERAHDIIVRNAATKHDPWLMASEIALADVAERKPRFFKDGVKMLDDGSIHPRQTTELAGAVATDDLLGGNRRKARKNFGKSLRDPTGSALAQGEWATSELGPDLVPVARLRSAPEPAEALALHLYRTGHLTKVADVCFSWATADPFSIRPYEFGSATAGFIEQFDKAVKLALTGLELRPKAPNLINSAAFALASADRLPEATEMLDRLQAPQDDRLRYWAVANRGLIAFRSGDAPLGNGFYNEAIEGFTKAGLLELAARARVYLARESLKAAMPNASELLDTAKKAIEPFTSMESLLTLKLLDQPLQKGGATKAPQTTHSVVVAN